MRCARDWKDLEDPPGDFRDAGVEELQLGRDFDKVVLGIPVGAHHRDPARRWWRRAGAGAR